MLRINLGLVLAELICLPAFVFEITRALDGNTLSWAYVFEWPLLGGYAVYMWHKLRQDERGRGPLVLWSSTRSIPNSTPGTRTWPRSTRATRGPSVARGTTEDDATLGVGTTLLLSRIVDRRSTTTRR